MRGQLSSGAIVRGSIVMRGGGQFSSGTIFFGGDYPREQLSGGNHPGGNYPGDNYPVGSFPRGQLS